MHPRPLKNMSRRTVFEKTALAALLLFLCGGVLMKAEAQQRATRILIQPTPPDPGLRVNPNSTMKVEIDLVQTIDLGLTERSVLRLCQTRLKEAGIPLEPDSATARGNILFFNVNVNQDSVSVTMAFAKLLATTIGQEKFLRRATTWTDNVAGLHRGSLDILQAGLRNALDRFVTEYLRANAASAQAE